MPDDGRLDRILSSLPPDDAAYLSRLVEPPWRQRARRLAQRDDAIRRALELLTGAPNLPAQLSTLMAQQAGQRWGAMTGNHLVVEAVGVALAQNDGAPLRERQIRNIAQGDRAPVQ